MPGPVSSGQFSRVVAITDVPLNDLSPNGFSPRYRAFVGALAAAWPTVLARVLLDETDRHSRYPPRVRGLVDVIDLPLRRARSRPASRWRSRLEVLRTTLLLPYPAQTIAPGARIHLEHPELVDEQTLVVTFLPFVAHLAFGLPPGARSVCVLDEAWVRFAGTYERRRLRLASRLDAPSHWLRYRQIGREADRVVTISARERRYFERFMPGSKLDVVPHAIDLDFFRPEPTEHRDIDVLIVGNLASPRYSDLPRLVAHVNDMAPRRLTWALVGTPSPQVQELASDRVLVPGRVEDVRAFYRRTRLVLVPARGDVGVKTTLLQAWAMALPAVTNTHALRAVEPPASLSSTAADGHADTARQILRLLGDPALCRRLGADGRRFVDAHYDMARLGERFRAVCRRVEAS